MKIQYAKKQNVVKKTVIMPKSNKEKEIFSAIIHGIATEHADELNVSVDTLLSTLRRAHVEIYQEKPFTTVVIKRVVNGKQIRGIGFTKYNLNDDNWSESRGRIRAFNIAYHAFVSMMVEKLVKNKDVTVRAIVSATENLEKVIN